MTRTYDADRASGPEIYLLQQRRQVKWIVGGIIGAIVAVLALLVMFGWWFTIDSGERGVVLRNGKVIAVADPGLHFKLPIWDSVVEISTRSDKAHYEKLAAYSRDQQPADISLSVNYSVPPGEVATVYNQYGSTNAMINRLLDPRVNEHMRNVFGRFNAVTAIQDRARLNAEIETAIRDHVSGPIKVESVQIENIDFSDAYEESVEARMLAEVEVAKFQQNAFREKVQAEITVIKAKADADSARAAAGGRADSNRAEANGRADALRAEAAAQANAIQLRGDAEALAIKARGVALGENPSLIALVQAEKWNGILPTTMIPGSAVPFLNVQK